MQTITLKEYRERHLSDGYIACSKNLSDNGFLKIDYVTSDWWIKTTDDRSYSCTPSERVYFTCPECKGDGRALCITCKGKMII